MSWPEAFAEAAKYISIAAVTIAFWHYITK